MQINRYHPDISDFQNLDSSAQYQIKTAGYIDFLWRSFLHNNRHDPSQRVVPFKDIYQGFFEEGMLYSTSANTTFKNYVVPPNCQYTGIYKFDSRCRLWFQQSIGRTGITPIEPIMFFSQASEPFLASNLCQRQMVKRKNSQGEDQWYPYSVDCLNFKLSTLYYFFNNTSFDNSKTIMIDPRSEKIVYNQFQSFSNKITYLTNAAQDLFPNQTEKQEKFLKVLRDYLDVVYNKYTTKQMTSATIAGNNDNHYEFYIQRVQQLEEVDLITDFDKVKSFEFDAGDGEIIFITLNPIMIIEKLGEYQRTQDNQQNRFGYEIQDLFLVIDILPKSYLTEFTDQLKEVINEFFVAYGTGSTCACVIFFIVCAFIAYKVALIIETPLSHMILLLKKLEKEGSQVALDLIDDQVQIPEDQIFLSLDSVILFDSFKSVFKMLHLATQDIFHVEESQSLLCLNYQISFFKQFNNYRVLGVCYNNMGNIHFQSERYNEAMEYYYHAIIYGQYELGLYQEKNFYISELDNNQDYLNQQTNPIKISSLKNKSSSHNTAENKILKNQIDQNPQVSACTTKEKIRNTNSSGRKEFSRRTSNQQDQCSNQHQQFFSEEELDRNLDTINQIIFDRKYNFSKALYMKNLQVGKHEAGVTTLWQEYEIILQDLLIFNQKLKSISYGRTILLTTQLSNCYLRMKDYNQAVNYQKQAIRAYNDALEIESLVKKFSSKKQQDNQAHFGGHLRLELRDDDDENKSSNKQKKDNSSIKNVQQDRFDENLNDSFKKKSTNKNDEQKSMQSPSSEYRNNTLDINYILQHVQKIQDEEVSIDNLFRKRYSNVHSMGESEQVNNINSNNNQINFNSQNSYSNQNSLQNNTLNGGYIGKRTDEENAIKNFITNNVTQNIKNAAQAQNGYDYYKQDQIIDDQNQNKILYDNELTPSPKSPYHLALEKERLNSEQSLFQRRPRRSKYLQGNFHGQETTRVFRDRKISKEKVNTAINQANNSFSTSRSRRSILQSQRNSLKHGKQNLLYSPQSNILMHNSLNNNLAQSNYQNNLLHSQPPIVKHSITLPNQQTQNNQFSFFLEKPLKSNTLQVRRHANTASQQQQTKQVSQSINHSIELNRPRSYGTKQQNTFLSNQSRSIEKSNRLSMIPSFLHQNGLAIDTLNNRTQNSHQSFYLNTINNNIKNPIHTIRCKDCSVYDDLASISSQQQQQQNEKLQYQAQNLIRKQKKKKKNNLVSKINKNLEENEGKKISKYQLPCNILLYYVGLQETKILIYEKKYQSAASLLTELLENVKYYLPYYRKQCLKLLSDIFHENHINQMEKLQSMIDRFDATITFKVTSIISVNTAYSDSAKTCQHLIKEVLTKDDDLFSLIIYNSHILKQVMPPTLMKQIKSASDYFDTLLSYISGDADSVDISSYTSDYEYEQIHSNRSIPMNQNHHLNSSFGHTITNQTYPVITENIDIHFQTNTNELKPLFTEKSHQDLLQNFNSQQQQASMDSNVFFNLTKIKGSSQQLIQVGSNQEILDPFKLGFQNIMMAPIRESSKEINLIESNFIEPNKILTPIPDSKFKIKNEGQNNCSSIYNGIIQHNKNNKLQNQESSLLLKNSAILENNENIEENELTNSIYPNEKQYSTQNPKHSIFTRKKSKSLIKATNNTLHSNSLPSNIDKPGRLERKRTNTLPNNSTFPTILINYKTLSQHDQEQQLLSSQNPKTINRFQRLNTDSRKVTSKFKQFNSTESQQLDSSDPLLPLGINKNISEITYSQNEQDTKENKHLQHNSIVILEENEEDDKHKKSSLSLTNSHLPLKRSSFAKQEEQKKSKSIPSRLSSGLIPSGPLPPASFHDKRFKSLVEQDEEQAEKSIDLHQRNRLLVIESLKRLSSKREIDEDIQTLNSLSFDQQSNQKIEDVNLSINESNLNEIFHLSIRKALLSFFEDDIFRIKLQRILTQQKVINKCKKFIVFITDSIGLKENKLYDMLAEELYRTQTQLLILQLNYNESLQENTQNQDVQINRKSIIKYFYTQEKLLQYIRNKREPMKNFGIPVMMEHFQ